MRTMTGWTGANRIIAKETSRIDARLRTVFCIASERVVSVFFGPAVGRSESQKEQRD